MMKLTKSPKRLQIRQQLLKNSEKPLIKEVNKMEQKLLNLKQQLKKKKEEKDQNKSLNSKANNFLSQGVVRSSKEIGKKEEEFDLILESLKMEKYKDTLSQYGVTSKSQLTSLSKIKVDAFDNIPIGFRIKLKKLVDNFSEEKPQPEKEEQRQYDIQEILEKRKKQRKFISLDKEIQEQQNFEDAEKEGEVESMMNQLFSILHKDKLQEVKQEKEQQKKYCWMCLREAKKPVEGDMRIFCGQGCQLKYEEKMKVNEDVLKVNEEYDELERKKDQWSIDLSIL